MCCDRCGSFCDHHDHQGCRREGENLHDRTAGGLSHKGLPQPKYGFLSGTKWNGSLTRVAGRAVLDDKVNVRHVNTASRNVSRHQDLEALCAERLDGEIALVLGDVAV